MNYIPLVILILFLFGCVPVATVSNQETQKKLLFDDANYEHSVGMTNLFPLGSTSDEQLDYPVAPIGSAGFQVEFDLLEENVDYLNAYFIHCNSNWKPSNLADIQFLNVYNEFSVERYNYSANTRMPYVNYQLQLPTPKISGNYLLVLYRENNQRDILFSRRLLVVEPIARIQSKIKVPSIISKRDSHQEVSVEVTYEGLSQVNPLQDLGLVLLQNHRWDNAIRGLTPTLIRRDENYIAYDPFDGKNAFPGWNEFRFFDLRSIDYRGQNISNIEKGPQETDAFLTIDKTRGKNAYTQLNSDLNGSFFLQNTDPDDGPFQSEYVLTHFELMSDSVDGEVYVLGAFNNWKKSSDSKMAFDSSRGTYRTNILLKQGFYDYCYEVKGKELAPYFFEGSHFQTENNYEILVYYRNPFNNYDELIGYSKISGRN